LKDRKRQKAVVSGQKKTKGGRRLYWHVFASPKGAAIQVCICLIF